MSDRRKVFEPNLHKHSSVAIGIDRLESTVLSLSLSLVRSFVGDLVKVAGHLLAISQIHILNWKTLMASGCAKCGRGTRAVATMRACSYFVPIRQTGRE